MNLPSLILPLVLVATPTSASLLSQEPLPSASSTSAGITVVEESSTLGSLGSQTWYGQISTTDLIQQGRSSLASANVSAAAFGGNGLNNGVGPTANTTNSLFWGNTQMPATATYDLNVAAAPQGYVVDGIHSYQGWTANSGLHANQNYTVEVSLVGSPDFSPLTTVDFDPFLAIDDSEHYSHVGLTGADGVLASGVDAIRFTFASPGSGGTAPGTVVNEIDVLGSPIGVVSPSPITINAPAERQVIQRGADNRADVTISGNVSGAPERIEARVTDPVSGVGSAWQDINASLASGKFTGVLPAVLAGGWYQLQVRTVDHGIANDPVLRDKVGVGDVYVTAGQSNSANHGGPAYTPTDDRVVARTSVSGNSWVKAADPQPIATSNNNKGSVWSRLGDLLVARTNVPIAFVSVGVGGSQLSQWTTGTGNFYDTRLKPVVQSFPANGFRAVLFHQGESDSLASTPTAVYQARLTQLIDQSRADAGWTIPWYISRASTHPSSSLNQELPVTAGQRNVVYADPLVFFGPRTDDFHLQAKVIDGVHFNETGFADFAAQWSDTLTGVRAGQVVNSSFEGNAALGDGANVVLSTTAPNGPSVIGWEALAASGIAPATGAGYYNPDARFYSRAADSGATGGVVPGMDARHVAFLSGTTVGDYFEQTFAGQVSPGSQVNLSVALGRRTSGAYGRACLQILADGVVVATRTVEENELTADAFTRVSVSGTVPASMGNDPALAIRIIKLGDATGSYLDADGVRFTVAP